ncbi:MAG TPA: RNA methyltransferase [Lutibacter sp.]|nr:RNA methyltransferase [Lutibacter sp.]
MQEIASKDNGRIKELRKLGSKKYRNKFGKFLVENLAIIYDAIKSSYKPEALFITQELLDNNSEKVQFILKNVRDSNTFIILESANRYFSSLDTPAGIAVIYNKAKKKNINLEKNILYLNEVKDPGNLGTILRSAVAFGVEDIVLGRECVELYNPKVIQSAKDAIFKINVTIDDDERNVLEKVKNRMKIFVTDVDGGAEVKDAFKTKNNFCVVMGSESHGVSEEVKNLADKTINIKSSPEMESLNVAVSTGIILYEMYNN